MPDVADPCGDVQKRESEPVTSGAIDDPDVAPVSRKNPRLGARKGQEKGNVLDGD